MEQNTHTIAKSIQQFCFRNLFSPVIYLVILFFVWFLFPFSDVLFPHQLSENDHLKDLYHQNQIYVETTLNNLSFSGYTCTFDGENRGYYYYTTFDDEIVFVLLSPKTCQEGLSEMNDVHISGVLGHNTKNFRQMLSSLSQDLNWTQEGLKTHVSSYYISEPDFHSRSTIVFACFYFASGAYALFSIITNIIYIAFPVLSPPCRKLKRYGNANLLFAQAEEELANATQLATEDMFVTEHYFIETSNYGVAIVPIQEILWIYKYSTMHKLFGHYFSISYTLHISANSHLDIRCPKNTKTDIDHIMDCLSKENPNILVGFSEENRLKITKKR